MLNQKDNTLVLLILGSPSLLEYDSKNQIKVTKYINYSFTAYAILIKRLSLQLGIKENHICTFALGKEKDYDITSLIDDNNIYVQLTTNEIYKTKCKKSELNFKYFSNATELSSVCTS